MVNIFDGWVISLFIGLTISVIFFIFLCDVHAFDRHFTDFILPKLQKLLCECTYGYIWPCFVPVRWFFIFSRFFRPVYLLLKVAFINNEFYGPFFFFFISVLQTVVTLLWEFWGGFQSLKKKWFAFNHPSFSPKILPYIVCH